MRVRDKIAALDAEEKKASRKGLVKEASLGLIGAGIFLGGLLSIVATPVAAIALCSLGAGVLSGYRKQRNERVAKVQAIRQEKANLRRLTQNGINVSAQSQQQRTADAAQANTAAATAQNAVKKAKEGTGLRRFNLGTASLLSMIIPGPVGIIATAATVGFAAYKLYKDNKVVKNNTIYENASAKKDYLDTESKIADNILSVRAQRRRNAAQAVANARGNANTNTNQRTQTQPLPPRRQPTTATTPVVNSSPSVEMSENERIVDEYIRRLSENPTDEETTSLTIR